MRFTTDDKHLIKWIRVKKLRRKTLAQYVFDRNSNGWLPIAGYPLIGKDADQNISARSLTLLIFAVEWALCGRPQPEHESVMPPNIVDRTISLTPPTFQPAGWNQFNGGDT